MGRGRKKNILKIYLQTNKNIQAKLKGISWKVGLLNPDLPVLALQTQAKQNIPMSKFHLAHFSRAFKQLASSYSSK